MPPETQNRDLTLTPDSYLYLQNEGKGGLFSVHRGPAVVNQTGQDQPVRYDVGARSFKPCSLEQAVQQFPRAAEGDYVVIENPSDENDGKKFPTETSQAAIELEKGRKIIIPGPWSEALYPGSIATVIEGHRLRTNQYLIAIVYNAEEAKKNWEEGTVADVQTELPSQTEGDDDSDDDELKTDAKSQEEKQPEGLPKPDSFAVGTRIIIKGTDVSFYIPCTGVEVLMDDDGEFVREAVTLEQMEYCCLIDESGKKEYPQGPKVVFPLPTQVFDKDSRSRRKFRPIELNTINGLHLKVTADFKGPDIEKNIGEEREFKEGEELFVTGKILAIYYPREEFKIIEYGRGNKKHFSTAIPKGEGRYVIERDSGRINLVKGPKMLLPDPRTQILMRRHLNADECRLMYPGNDEAVAYNQELAEAMAESPSGRSGVVSEGDWKKRQEKIRRASSKSRGGPEATYLSDMSSTQDMSLEAFAANDEFSPEEAGETGRGGSIRRGTKYTEPRQLTLNTKYDGVPKIEVWPGFAILIVGAEGSRRVVEGPETVLLEYDEKLGHMSLSMGKPKSTDNLLTTGYLCVQNNQVGDICAFESKDHVKGKVKISLRVNFESEDDDDKLDWFSTDNYIKYLCDHVRSIIAGMAKRHPIAEIKANYVDLMRDTILGRKPSRTAADDVSTSLTTKRPGLGDFTNRMRVIDVEVLNLSLDDSGIATLLDQAQHQVVESNIRLDQARKQLETAKEEERISQETDEARHVTQQKRIELEKLILDDKTQLAVSELDAELEKIVKRKDQRVAEEDIKDVSDQARLARESASLEQDHKFEVESQTLVLEKLDAETLAKVKQFEAMKDGLAEALIAIQRDDVAAKLAEACTIERFLAGDSMQSSISNLVSMFPALQGFIEVAQNGRGNRLTQRESTPSS